MALFKIISMETFENWLGTIKKGEEINAIHAENLTKAKQWAYESYGPYGENIKHIVVEVK